MHYADTIKTLQNLQGIIGAFGFLAAAVFGAMYGKKKAEKDQTDDTVTDYEKSAQAKDNLIATREKEISDKEHIISELTVKHDANLKRIQDLETTVKVLNEKFTQAPSITELGIQIGKQHSEMMKQMGAMTKELGNIAKSLPKVIKLEREE